LERRFPGLLLSLKIFDNLKVPRTKSHFQGKEPLLESILQNIRFGKAYPFVKEGLNVLDLGCGYNASFLKKISPVIKTGLGIDGVVTKEIVAPNIKLISHNLEEDLNLPPNHFDLVVSLAVLEHITDPEKFVKQIYRSLKKNGRLIMTTPSPMAKPVLEFLSFRLGVVSKQEIHDHKNYFSKTDITTLLINTRFSKSKIQIKLFTFGLNTFVVAKK
jgi:SAM-dependent methyltransferase